jgi:hypothetical protein
MTTDLEELVRGLGAEFTDPRALPVLERVRREDPDPKIRAHAQKALARLAAAGAVRRSHHRLPDCDRTGGA